MTVGNFIFFLLTALVAVNLIFAESGPPPQAGGEHQDPPPQEGPQEGPQGGPNQEPNGRFFSSLGSFSGCNYTATPGATCLNCNTASRCLPNNVAYVRVCRGFLPNCNNGRCSFIATANCSASG